MEHVLDPIHCLRFAAQLMGQLARLNHSRVVSELADLFQPPDHFSGPNALMPPCLLSRQENEYEHSLDSPRSIRLRLPRDQTLIFLHSARFKSTGPGVASHDGIDDPVVDLR